MKSIFAVIAILFVSLFSRPLMAVENASWGEVKSLVAEAPAGKLVVSANKAGGWLGRANQPTVQEGRYTFSRGDVISQPAAVRNSTGRFVAGADVVIGYDPEVFQIRNVAMARNNFVLAYNDIGGSVKIAVSSAYGDNSTAFTLFWLDYTVRPDAPVGAAAITASFVFYDEHSKKIGFQTAEWVIVIK